VLAVNFQVNTNKACDSSTLSDAGIG
jgi:hypothetical protein